MVAWTLSPLCIPWCTYTTDLRKRRVARDLEKVLNENIVDLSCTFQRRCFYIRPTRKRRASVLNTKTPKLILSGLLGMRQSYFGLSAVEQPSVLSSMAGDLSTITSECCLGVLSAHAPACGLASVPCSLHIRPVSPIAIHVQDRRDRLGWSWLTISHLSRSRAILATYSHAEPPNSK